MLRRLLPAAVLAASACVNACAAGVEDVQPSVAEDVIGGPANASPEREGPLAGTSSKKSTETAKNETGGPLFRASADAALAASSLNSFDRYEAALQSDGTLTIAQGKGVAGTDPQPSGYHGGSFYNGGTYRHAAVSSPIWQTATPFDSVTPSFEASTPEGTWLEVRIAAHVVATGQWTKEYSLGVWAYDDSTVRRHSVAGQGDGDADVATDTLKLASPADAFHVTVLLFADDAVKTPTVRAVSAIATPIDPVAKTVAANPAFWGKTLDVPKHSQMIYATAEEKLDSPTSIAMLLGYWGIVEAPPDVATLCLDVALGSAGNRPFSTAHAAAIADGKMHSMVTRMSSFGQLEPLLAAGVPVAIGIAYANGSGSNELTGAPIASTTGRLVVVKGFDSKGNVVVNDPGFATDDTVETTYDRAELTAAWRRSSGTTYLVWPQGKKLPSDSLGAY